MLLSGTTSLGGCRKRPALGNLGEILGWSLVAKPTHLFGVARMKTERLIRAVLSVLVADTWKASKKGTVLFVCHDHNRSEIFSGKQYSPLLDPLRLSLERQGISTISLATFGSLLFGAKAHGRPVSINRGVALYTILDFLAGALGNSKARLNSNFRQQFYLRILITLRTQVVITIGIPGGLQEACSKLGVQLYEVFHGFGYATLPWNYGLLSTEGKLPSGVVLFDSLSHATMMKIGGNNFEIIRSKPWHLEYPSPPGFRVGNKRVQSLQSKESESRTRVIVAFGRGGHFGRPVDSDRIDWDFIELLLGRHNLSSTFAFRMHPVHSRSRLGRSIGKKLAKLQKEYGNIQLRMGEEESLTRLLHWSDLLFTDGSEVVFDAAYCGVRSAIFLPSKNPSREDFEIPAQFSYLVANGFVDIIPPTIEAVDRVFAQFKEREQSFPQSFSTFSGLDLDQTAELIVGKLYSQRRCSETEVGHEHE